MRHAKSIKKEVIGYFCDNCGWSDEERPERCPKCGSYAIEVLEKERLPDWQVKSRKNTIKKYGTVDKSMEQEDETTNREHAMD